jgi:peptide deformylase
VLKAIRKYSDPALSSVCAPVTDKKLVAQIAQDLRDTLKKSKIGVGMAAPQIGYIHRVVLVMDDIIMVNPEIINTDGQQNSVEGCLSYPNVFATIKRPMMIVVKYLNEDMEEKQIMLADRKAAVCCHEIDHLNGRCAVKPNRKRTAA